jgi:hypothetical protein
MLKAIVTVEGVKERCTPSICDLPHGTWFRTLDKHHVGVVLGMCLSGGCIETIVHWMDGFNNWEHHKWMTEKCEVLSDCTIKIQLPQLR